jgi:hypothetical protein
MYHPNLNATVLTWNSMKKHVAKDIQLPNLTMQSDWQKKNLIIQTGMGFAVQNILP